MTSTAIVVVLVVAALVAVGAIWLMYNDRR